MNKIMNSKFSKSENNYQIQKTKKKKGKLAIHVNLMKYH